MIDQILDSIRNDHKSIEPKKVVIMLVILSNITTILGVLGLIFANINLFTLAMIILILTVIPTIKYFNYVKEAFNTRNGEIIDDERQEHISDKATLPAFVSMLIFSSYSGIGILTLRNIYPEYTMLSYTLFITFIVGLITFTISKAYYKRKYGN
jgi:uncharacterized membrane protein